MVVAWNIHRFPFAGNAYYLQAIAALPFLCDSVHGPRQKPYVTLSGRTATSNSDPPDEECDLSTVE